MKTFGEFPTLMKAFGIIGADNGMSVHDDLAMRTVPAKYAGGRFAMAEAQAASLSGRPLRYFLPEGEIDVDNHEPTSDALEVICMGEQRTQSQLQNVLDLKALTEVLASAFDGTLSLAIYQL